MKFLRSIKNWFLDMFESNEKTKDSKNNISDNDSHEYRIG